MSQNSSSNSGGIGLCGLLTVAFIVLKLCNVIAWSWVWVLAPLWIPAAIALVIIVICLLIWLIDHK
jgi:Flp pilus assembly protein TadB